MPIITGRSTSGDVVDIAVDNDGKLKLSGTLPISGTITATTTPQASISISGVSVTVPMSGNVTATISGTAAVETRDVLERYKFSDTKTITATDYFGYLDKDGNWYILQLTAAAGRYTSGGSDYATNYALADSL